MKFFTTFCLLLLVLALILPLWLKDPAGKPIMVLDDWFAVPGKLREIVARGRSVLAAAAPAAESGFKLEAAQDSISAPGAGKQYYRWKDERGRWQFSDQPPDQDVAMPTTEVQTEKLPNPRNILPANTAAALDSTGTAPPMDSTIAPAVSLPEQVSREAMEKMLEDAHRRRLGAEL